MSIENTYTTLAQLSEICVAHDVKYAVLSPGSRSAPVALSFMRNTGIIHFVIADERSAAYTALGLSRQTQSPVVLICTSGTAALNYAPAIAEAFFCEMPLIVLTADRPQEWIAQADNQSIFQENIYGKHVKATYNFPVDFSAPESVWQAQRQMNEALIIATDGRQGPVHINIPLREPLYMLNALKNVAPPQIIRNHVPAFGNKLDKDLLEKIKGYKKVLFVAGMMKTDSTLVSALESLPNANILVDITSNLHQVSNVILYSDMLCSSGNNSLLNKMVPDLVISFGGPLVSKQLKTFLRKNQIQEHWHVGEGIPAPDTFQHLTQVIKMPASKFISSLASSGISFNRKYHELWQSTEDAYVKSVENGFKKSAYSESSAVWKILKDAPSRSILHVGNSLAIRHVTAFPGLENISEVYSNRGTSGIDGSVSSAAGQSMVDERTHLLIIGDQSFMYDSNGLWNKYLKGNLKIIILNNYGGRIFESLPGASVQAELEEYFVTEQPLSFEHIAAHHGIDYFSAENDKQLGSVLASFFKARKAPSILELKFKNGISLGDVKKGMQL